MTLHHNVRADTLHYYLRHVVVSKGTKERNGQESGAKDQVE